MYYRRINEIKCRPVYLVAPRGRKTAIIRTLSDTRRGAKEEDRMKCELCEKSISKGKTYFNVEIEYNESYDTWFEGYSICKECFEKYSKEELVSKIENKRQKEKNNAL